MVAELDRPQQRDYRIERTERQEPRRRGFQMPARTVLLSFEDDSPYCGAEVRCTLRMTLEQTLALQRMTSVQADGDIESAARTFAETVLVSWNLLDDDGQPIPATPEAFLAQPADFVIAVINYWQAGVTQPDAPLASPATNGEPSADYDAVTDLS